MITGQWGSWLGFLGFLHLLVFLVVAYHCLQNRRPATSALLWIFVAWAFPVVGALFYLAFGINRLPVKGWLKHEADQKLLSERQKIEEGEAPELVYWRAVHNRFMTEPPTDFGKTLNTAMDASLKEYPLLGGNDVKPLLNGDEAYPAMLDAIRKAEHHIHLVSFIIRNDESGRNFMEALASKAREGCEIRLIFDRFGSSAAVFSGFFRKYRSVPNFEIVSWTQANLLKRQLQYNLRNHRKILVVDGKKAFIGGINISDSNVTRGKTPPFEDFHFKVSGPVVQELQYTFLRDWHFMTRQSAAKLLHQRFFPELPAVGSGSVRIINSGPTTGEMKIISDIVFSSIVSARCDIVAVTPYFVPGDDLLQAIRTAALRGVRTRLIVPEKNNHTIAGWAARARYQDLLEAGVEIYERRPPLIHAKALIIDDEVALIGTANLDERSLRLNYETNLAVYEQKFIAELKQLLIYELSQSNSICLATWLQRPRQQRILENFCNLFSPVL
ncbi:MAG: cardiolipin synthase [Lentisphaeria bacterium]